MRISLPSGTAAELCRPAAGEVSRGLVIAPDIMGLRPLFEALAARLAEEQGWTVCVPEPFAGREEVPLDRRLQIVGELDDMAILADLVAAADATECDAVGVIGFCMGGMYTLKAAGSGRFDAAVAFYGMIHVPEQWQSETQGDPLERVAAPGACPTMAIIGTEDPWTPTDHADELEAAGVTVVRYEGAEHGFVHDPDRPAHRADDARDAWARAIGFLSERGG